MVPCGMSEMSRAITYGTYWQYFGHGVPESAKVIEY
jgi:hypothetical protein